MRRPLAPAPGLPAEQARLPPPAHALAGPPARAQRRAHATAWTLQQWRSGAEASSFAACAQPADAPVDPGPGESAPAAQPPAEAEPAAGAPAEPSPEEARRRRRRLWYLAIKPPMYSVCVVPVLVGAAAAFADTGRLLAARTGQLLLGSVLIIAWLNLSNDAFDASMGVDGGKAESVVNLTGSRQGVLWTANAFLAAGAYTLWQATSATGDARIGWMLGAAIAMGYMYQGPPFRLSYRGLGEPITFVTFGPLATSAFYLAHVAGASAGRRLVSHSAAAASVVVGLSTAAILFCSHFHQLVSDKAAGKLSPIVRLGSTTRGLQVLRWAVAATYSFAYAAVACRWLPWTAALTLPLSIPAAGAMLRFCADNHRAPVRIRPLKLRATTWHTALGLALALSFVAVPHIRFPAWRWLQQLL